MQTLKDLIKSVESKQSWIDKAKAMIEKLSSYSIAVSASGYCEVKFNPSESRRIKDLVETIIKEREESLKPQLDKLNCLSDLIANK